MNWRSILELMTDGADVCQCEPRWCYRRLLWCWCYHPENHFASLDEWAPRGDSLPAQPPTIASMSCFMMTGAWPLIWRSATASWEVWISWRIVSPFTIKSAYKSKSEKERSNGARSWLCSATAQRHPPWYSLEYRLRWHDRLARPCWFFPHLQAWDRQHNPDPKGRNATLVSL